MGVEKLGSDKMVDVVSLTIVGLVMIMIYSYMVKDNLFYRFAENTLTAIAIGYTAAYGVNSILRLGITPLISGNLVYLIPVIIGSFVFSRYISKYSYLNRWSLSMVVGIGSGVAMRTMIDAQIVKQILAVIQLPLYNVSAPTFIGNLLTLTSVPCVLFYFFFTREFKHPIMNSFRMYGRYILMVAFGAVFAAYITTRLSMLEDNFYFIIITWIKASLGL